MSELAWIQVARSKIGTKEIKGPKHNPVILAMWKAIKRGGIKDDETAWCAAFVGASLEEAGIVSTRFESAASYLSWGIPTKLVYGAVVVITRTGGSGYHVGFAVGRDSEGNVMVLGGNQGDSVNISAFNPNRIVACRWPKAVPIELTPLPLLAKSKMSTGEA